MKPAQSPFKENIIAAASAQLQTLRALSPKEREAVAQKQQEALVRAALSVEDHLNLAQHKFGSGKRGYTG